MALPRFEHSNTTWSETARLGSQGGGELATELHGGGAGGGVAGGGGAEELGHGGGEAAQALGVLEGVALHVGDDLVAEAEVVEEGAAGGHVVDGAGQGVDVGAGVELDG